VLLYFQSRLPVELLFKRMKQLRRLGQIRSTSTAGATATIRALLVAWLLQAQESAALRALLPQLCPPRAATAAEPAVISSWTLTGLGLETLRQQVVGSWSAARVQACLPRLVRFLAGRSQRPHQETEVRAWLLGQNRRRQPTARAGA